MEKKEIKNKEQNNTEKVIKDEPEIKNSEEIQNFISTEITASVRELVGAINRTISFSRIPKISKN